MPLASRASYSASVSRRLPSKVSTSSGPFTPRSWKWRSRAPLATWRARVAVSSLYHSRAMPTAPPAKSPPHKEQVADREGGALEGRPRPHLQMVQAGREALEGEGPALVAPGELLRDRRPRPGRRGHGALDGHAVLIRVQQRR